MLLGHVLQLLGSLSFHDNSGRSRIRHSGNFKRYRWPHQATCAFKRFVRRSHGRLPGSRWKHACHSFLRADRVLCLYSHLLSCSASFSPDFVHDLLRIFKVRG